MGLAYSAECQCGYQEDELMDGCGMTMQQYAIVECSKCKRFSSKYLGTAVSSVEEAIRNKRCGHCRCGGLAVYEVSDSGKNRYPQCGKNSLAFFETMLWD
ncbi:MAG: hypothetical protein ABW157_19820 [Candidatus Thiodiazotropha sp. LLP2]|nr:hypothetical protein [Candidatus Thiodiazotropha lotti]MCW4209950.1 hypothetical protein [Candidatus Thiodiazotropha lotti]